MKLSECSIGVIVTESREEKELIGHVVGLYENPSGEVIPVVRFANNAIPRPIHHGNLKKYTG